MPQNFLSCEREQVLLMAPSLRDWLPEDHLAWFILATVEKLDRDAFYASSRADGHGRAAHDPAMMVALVYAYARGQRSSRGIERACVEDIEQLGAGGASPREDGSTRADRLGVRRWGDAGDVPTISRFYGIVIRMYLSDHAPPHFHAVYADQEAVIAIAGGAVLRGSLPDRALRMVREWASIHRDELARQLGAHAGSPAASADRAAAMTASRTTITDVEPLTGRWVRLTFADGAVHEIDLAGVLEAGGVFASIRDDRDTFEAVAVDHEFGTITWPGDIDLDPDVLRGDQAPDSGTAIPRRVIQPA